MSQPKAALPSEGRQARNNQRQKHLHLPTGMRPINMVITMGQVAAWELPPGDICL